MKRIAQLLLALSTLGIPASAQVAASDPAARVDSLYRRLDSTVAPGFAVSVVRDGRTILSRGYGYANLEHRVRITPSTVFDVASVSKQFAGLAVAMLVADGRVALDSSIRTYIPELQPVMAPVTVRHLLHHTGGIRDWPGTLAVGGWSFEDVISFQQILSLAYNQRTVNFAPGAEYLYSNTGYNLLAEMVQRVSGKSFRAFTDSTIFRPLGMSRSHFRDDHAETIADAAAGYQLVRGTYRHTPNGLTALGSSSMVSTVEDLARWLANFDGARVGGPEATRLMRTRGRLTSGDSIPYAFGIIHGSYRGLANLSHGGSWASFRTYVVWYPGHRVGIAVLANGNGTPDPTLVANQVANVYLERELAPIVPATSASAETVPVPGATLDEYLGLYRLGPGWYARIARSGDALTTQATRENAMPMTARSQTEFWVPAYNASMTFTRDAAGKVTGLLYRGSRAPRVDERALPTPTPPERLVGFYTSPELRTDYEVVTVGGTPMLQHARHGRIPLTRVLGDEYTSDAWFARSVAFERDGAGRISALVINGDARSRNIRFLRRP